MSLELIAPSPLTLEHQVTQFSSGETVLDDWLKRRAIINQGTGASRTFVVADRTGQVFGYYALAAGALSHQLATGGTHRNMPDPIPVLVLARLAVDSRAQGRHLGTALVRDAVIRSATVSLDTGVRALIVQALHERAQAFYEHCGFQPSPVNPLTLMLRLSQNKG